MSSEFVIEQAWQADHRSPVRWIWSHVMRHPLPIFGVLLGAFGNAALASAVPALIGRAFSILQAAPPDFTLLLQVVLLVIASQLLRGLVLQLGRNLSSETLGQLLERDIRNELYTSLVGKSMSFHDSYLTGDLMARATNDVREINLMLNPGFNMVIGSANFLIMPVLVAPRYHPQLIIIPLFYLLIYGFMISAYLRRLNPVAVTVRQAFGRMNTTLAEAIEGVETVKGASQERHEISRFSQAVERWRTTFLEQSRLEAQFIPLLLLGLLQAAGLFHSLTLFRAGALELEGVIAFNGLLLLFGFPTWSGQFAYTRVASGMASARRLLEVINAPTELDRNANGRAAPVKGAVTFEKASFCYRGNDTCGGHSTGDLPFAGTPTLQDLSFHVEPGQTVAIVGQTGSGKSTIAKLLNRIYDVDSGRVLVDGVDVRDWDLEALRRQISIIEQDVFLFSRSVAENIAFGNPEATREQIVAAAQAAQAHDFITEFKDGYDTIVGERGTTLSGGQRQRIALARAFLTNPAILVLDDATSAIDSATEDRIQRAIEKAAANRTTFLITHRLSQIRWADLIIVMRKGRIAAIGTHETLMATSEAYRNIFARYE